MKINRKYFLRIFGGSLLTVFMLSVSVGALAYYKPYIKSQAYKPYIQARAKVQAYKQAYKPRIKARAYRSYSAQPNHWSVNIAYQDLNGGAPRPGDLIEFTITTTGMPTDPNYAVDVLSPKLTQPFGNIIVTQLPNCGATDLSGPDYLDVIIDPRAQTGCPYRGSVAIKFVAPLLAAPTGQLITRETTASWIYGGCQIHNCWPENSVHDKVQFKMNYVPYFIQAR